MASLGLDTGNKTGVSILYRNLEIVSHVFHCDPPEGKRYSGGGMKFMLFREHLGFVNRVIETSGEKLEAVFFEEVRNFTIKVKGRDMPGVALLAAQNYASYTAVLMEWCESAKPEKIPYTGINASTIKKFATGKGNASKDAMLAAARAKWPDHPFEDHNEADARFIALCGAASLGWYK